MSILHNPQALLFDVDGTLADTEGQGHLPAFNKTFAAHNLPWRWSKDEYRRLLTAVPGGRERILEQLKRTPPPEHCNQTLAEYAQQLHREKGHHYTDILRSGAIKPRPGVTRLIEEAYSSGTTLAIVTTSARESVEALFEYVLPAKQRHYFSLLICGEDVSAKKPDPEAYQLAVERLCLPPDNCLALEDSVNGLAAANKAGIPTLITYNEWTKDDDFSDAWRVVESLDNRGDGEPVTLAWLTDAHT
ncbi:hypothetical protein HH1059_07740 [Halorhodospira halochloris]|uniref:Uncharacterized protein n=1 Tax=Halorhodospira halochloris TaxID=1052 RepID=A0A0X8X8F5_HALHR|nr:HAD-IA family hydrolase [Halorhodospira halochloris]MBK1651192.1 phosphatase [Halorhodospira halochloris]BAU57464.1 hypothetical protein HH1059_07740 [Halorhodospira halochloris]